MSNLFPAWRRVETGNYWRSAPGDDLFRWHVSKKEVGWVHIHTRIDVAGWYWYTVNWEHQTSTSDVRGPFTSPEAAMADCEAAHKDTPRAPERTAQP